MATGKYSPTVNFAYDRDQKWWNKNKTDDQSWYDDDGYDSYGYDKNNVDRAGINELDYMVGKWDGDDEEAEYVYPLYDKIYAEWRHKSPVGIKFEAPDDKNTEENSEAPKL